MYAALGLHTCSEKTTFLVKTKGRWLWNSEPHCLPYFCLQVWVLEKIKFRIFSKTPKIVLCIYQQPNIAQRPFCIQMAGYPLSPLIMIIAVVFVEKHPTSGVRCTPILGSDLTFSVKKMPQSGVGSMQGSRIFLWRSSSPSGCLPPQVVFHLRSSSTTGHLPLKVVFH